LGKGEERQLTRSAEAAGETEDADVDGVPSQMPADELGPEDCGGVEAHADDEVDDEEHDGFAELACEELAGHEGHFGSVGFPEAEDYCFDEADDERCECRGTAPGIGVS
jgi:hypothetical protein